MNAPAPPDDLEPILVPLDEHRRYGEAEFERGRLHGTLLYRVLRWGLGGGLGCGLMPVALYWRWMRCMRRSRRVGPIGDDLESTIPLAWGHLLGWRRLPAEWE